MAASKDMRRDAPSLEQQKKLLAPYEKGNMDEAEKVAISHTQTFPSHPFSWKVWGAVLRMKGKKIDAARTFLKAVALSPEDFEAYNSLGLTLHEIGELKESESALRKAIVINPDCVAAYYNLGNTLKKSGQLKKAESTFEKAIGFNPHFAEAYNNLGNTQRELGRTKNARASYSKAVEIRPNFTEAYHNLGSILQEVGEYEQAEFCFRKVLASRPDHHHSDIQLLTCLYLMDKEKPFLESLFFMIDQGQVNATLGSLTGRSALRYGYPNFNSFCNEPLRYVCHINLNYQYNFKENIVEKLRTFLNDGRVTNRSQPLLVKGYQTHGNLFEIENHRLGYLEKIIRSEIGKYQQMHSGSKEGFIKNWPKKYDLYGWIVSMKSGGSLRPHIHSQGWLSGSIYINVPRKKTHKSGNLVLSLGEEKDARFPRKNRSKVLNVVTGSMVLFPASLLHHTIPFESDEDRIVFAFDVKSLQPS